jgi:hypothetical protein
MGARASRHADDRHGIIELRPALLAGELAPSAPCTFKAAVHDEAKVSKPLGAVVTELAGARIARIQPV